MSLGEFEVIRRYFSPLNLARADVTLGIGDDAALCRPPPGMEVAVAVDSLVAGVHFPAHTSPRDVGHKALAVNLSDLAAMGAEPAWLTLALTLPEVEESWLAEFSRGLGELAARYQMSLIGGDTTRGPLCISVQVMGLLPEGRGLTRNGARPGDAIYLTGTVGDAGLGLRQALGHSRLKPATRDYLLGRLHRPTPRIAEGLALRGVASAAIDVSDGLLADLGHLLEAGNLGARLDLARLPLSAELRAEVSEQDAWELALAAGDDYELCFTVSPETAAFPADISCQCIGRIEDRPGIRCYHGGREWLPTRRGYEHYT